MSLLPPIKVGKLQETLHAKAKESPDYRFYALYDKVYRTDVLWHAYRICQTNGGAPGVDGQTFEDIEQYGQKRWLDELTDTSRRWLLLSEDDQVARLNRSLSGWANYFCLGPVSKAYQTIDQHTRRRLRRWLCAKRRQNSRGHARYPNEYLYAELGLTQLAHRTRNFPWAKT